MGMSVLDAHSQIVEANPALTAALGYSIDELEGQKLAAITHPDDVGRDSRVMDRLSRGVAQHIHTQRRLLRADGEVIWTRTTFSRVEGEPVRIIAQIEDLTETRRAQDLLEHRALHDNLTGLPNRVLLLDRLTVALESAHQHAACIFLDIDDFTLINDSLGHEAGDQLIMEVASRIESVSRPGDTVARLGGDEFVVIAPGVEDSESAIDYATQLQEAVNRPIPIDGHDISPTASAGISLTSRGDSAQGLLRDADVAMSSAKRTGRNRCEVFSEHMGHDAKMRLSVESELRAALREGQLEVHFQPVVNLITEEIRAFEALVRWRHPNRGLLLPDEFMGICEHANLVPQLGEIVLRDACRFLAERPHFDGRVLVNISTQQIGGAGLVEAVQEALAVTGVAPTQLALEITETGMLLPTTSTRAELAALDELGVDLLLDDFGTGYSALSSVLSSPVTGMKLAREFTCRLGDDSTGDRISTAISSLVNSLSMVGIIEGVETATQRDRAITHGWELGQGFLFGHPLPSSEISYGRVPAAS